MSVLIKPIITEKMTSISEKLSSYGFVVDKKASKDSIKIAVEKMYNVNVVSVNTLNCIGKKKSRNTKSTMVIGRTSSYKKAVVKVKEGEIIDFFSNI